MYFREEGVLRRKVRERTADSVILDAWHLSRPCTKALTAPIRAANSELCITVVEKERERVSYVSIKICNWDRIDRIQEYSGYRELIEGKSS